MAGKMAEILEGQLCTFEGVVMFISRGGCEVTVQDTERRNSAHAQHGVVTHAMVNDVST